MIDYATAERQAFIASCGSLGIKMRLARDSMGERYVCHPSNQVKKQARPVESRIVDVTRTFDRVRKQGKDLV